MLAERADDSRAGALARMSLARIRMEQGKMRDALAQADEAIALLDGVDWAQAVMQRALIEQRSGRLDAALEGYDAALPVLRELGVPASEARLLVNRGILRGYRGELSAADADLREADRLVTELGLKMRDGILQNRAFIAARRGDIPAALRFLDQAAAVSPGGKWRALILADRARMLLGVPLVEEAAETAAVAVRDLFRGRRRE